MDETSGIALEVVLAGARRLSAMDKVRLLEAMLPEIALAVEKGGTTRLQSCYGLLSDLGPAPSSADIEEIRKEMFLGFPRADAA